MFTIKLNVIPLKHLPTLYYTKKDIQIFLLITCQMLLLKLENVYLIEYQILLKLFL